jgi:spore coat polysaccharide biosynthesis protein SpsF (cytidylyltransferase family)/aryl-alcohol dehydrogenase-like predicted oxidoreductase
MTARRTRIVLQARMTSSRLAAKSLLPVGGLPLAVLCAKRLATAGHEVVLATSVEATDDLLATTAAEAGVRVFRGSLGDVQQRFLDCIADLSDGDLVVRATADNPFPDGAFVEALLAEREATGLDYLGTASPADGLPYGLSAEVFTVGALRLAACGEQSSEAREHVTVDLRRNAGAAGAVRRGWLFAEDHSRLRVTIDTFEDYLAMACLFRRVACPELVGWRELIRLVADGTRSCELDVGSRERGPGASIMLGTVQLGLSYGIANKTGRPDDGEATRLLCKALEGGIWRIDTARAYGDAERRLGELLPKRASGEVFIVSKLRPLSDCPDDAAVREINAHVDASVFGSCRDLARSRVDVMMFHRVEDMFRWGGAALARLVELQALKVIGAIGVSVYSPHEAIRCLKDPRITHVQIPFNMLDGRWLAPDFQDAIASRPDVEVHVRSVFLQGLLLGPADIWPSWAESRQLRAGIDSLVNALPRRNAADLCIAYVRAFPWVSSLVLGAETSAQLDELIALAAEPPLSVQETATVRAKMGPIPERLLNPALWN